MQRKIDLNEIVIDRPSVHLSVGPNGRSNWAMSPPASSGRPPTEHFRPGNRHILPVNQGELDYHDRHIPLDAEVHDLHAQVAFDSAKTEYDGGSGIVMDEFDWEVSIPYCTACKRVLGQRRPELTLDSFVLEAGSSKISAQGHLQDYGNPSVEGSYQADISTRELGRILEVTSIPVGQVNLRGTLHYQHRTDHPIVENISAAGQFRSPVMAINMPQAHVNVRGLAGEYHLSGGTLEVRNAHADGLGGKASRKLHPNTLIRAAGGADLGRRSPCFA